MFTEYDQEIIDILQDMNFVNEHFDDARIPGNIQSSAATVSRKGSTTSIGHPAAGNKGVVIGSGRAHGGRSRSLYFSSNDLVK